jgi:hypothetical protein
VLGFALEAAALSLSIAHALVAKNVSAITVAKIDSAKACFLRVESCIICMILPLSLVIFNSPNIACWGLFFALMV